MDRRAFLAGAGTAGVAGLAGCMGVLNRGPSGSTEQFEQRTVDVLAGADASELAVPVEGSVTVIDLFATWCGPCKPALDRMAEARTQVDGDVRFVSITNEMFTDDFTAADVRSWWDEHGGAWTVAHAPADVSILRHFGTRTLPTSIVTAPNRSEVWRHTGVPETGTLVEQIERARS